MKACCLQGSVHTGTPVGRVEKLHELDCYITEPPNSAEPKALIVYLPDAFGWDLVNNRLLVKHLYPPLFRSTSLTRRTGRHIRKAHGSSCLPTRIHGR